MPPTRSLGSTTWNWSRCWTPSGASRLLHEPPDAEPHVRWCGRTARVTSPPTRSVRIGAGLEIELVKSAKARRDVNSDGRRPGGLAIGSGDREVNRARSRPTIDHRHLLRRSRGWCGRRLRVRWRGSCRAKGTEHQDRTGQVEDCSIPKVNVKIIPS